MSEAKKVYALIESWDHYSSDFQEVFHRAFWLSRPTVEQVLGVFGFVDRDQYTKEAVAELVETNHFKYSAGGSECTTYIAEYEISE